MNFPSEVIRWALSEWYRRQRANPPAIESLLHPPHQSQRTRSNRSGISPARGIGATVSPAYPYEYDAFMESGLVKIINATEEDFQAAIYYSNNNKAFYARSPTWLDWIGPEVVNGEISGKTRLYTAGMPPLTWDRSKIDVTPGFLIGVASGKMKMLTQSQMGTVYGSGSISMGDFIADGGIVF